MTWLVSALFFLSGALALTYEVAWVRVMTLQFGSTTLAVSTVVGVFMAGLAAGAAVAGRLGDRIGPPLRAYAWIEVGLALYAATTPWTFPAVLSLFGAAGASVSDGILFLSLVRMLIAALLLLPPTLAMGATLPLLSRFYADLGGDGAAGAGWLYGVNTIGAFVGTAAIGFWMLPGLGVRSSILAAAVVNLGLAAVALLAARRAGRRAVIEPRPETRSSDASAAASSAVLCAVGVTGFAALAAEVAWTRVMVLVLGASVYAFSVVLATFLAGIGLGAALVSRLIQRTPGGERTLFWLLAVGSAAAVALTTALSLELPALFARIFDGWGLAERPALIVRAQVVLAGSVILLPTLLMGGLFPVAARLVVRRRERTAESVGRLYAVNTVGSILGSVAAGFLLIPSLGLRGTLLLVAGLQAGAGLLVVAGSGRPVRSLVQAVATVAVVATSVVATPSWAPQLMTSAIYHYADAYEASSTPELAEELSGREELLFYRDGLTATVTVSRDLITGTGDLYIATNGKIDGSSHYDMPTQRLSAHLPLLVHPRPRDVAVIGLGTGSTAGSASLHPLDGLSVVEIEPAMVEGARFFAAHNHGVVDDPEVDLRVTDGRLFLRLRPRAFDVLISEPSNPWLAGTSDLFTREFFELGRAALKEGGIFAQWVQLYGLAPSNLRMLVRTFASVFAHVHVASTIPEADLLLLGSEVPLQLEVARIARGMRRPRIRRDLGDPRVGVDTVAELLARLRMGPDEIPRFVGSGPLHTDDLPHIAYLAPRDLHRSTREENMRLLARHARGSARYLTDLPEPPAEFFRRLAAAYEAFLPGGAEAAEARRAASRRR